jgi:predicted AAA+ superfamily ATPase
MISQSQINEQSASVLKMVIKHPIFNDAYRLIKGAYEFKVQTGMAQHFLLVGSSGAGKTHLSEFLAKELPASENNTGINIPLLLVEIPSMPTIKNLAEEILVQLGDPLYYRGSATQKTARILQIIKASQIKLIIFDEMHHFVEQGSIKTTGNVALWLKSLINKTKVSTVLMGLEHTQAIININSELRRRLLRRIELKPFDLDCPTSRGHFLGIIKKFDEALAMPSPLDLQQEGLTKQLHFATNGLIGYMAKLILGAFQIARSHDLPAIDRQCLEQAFSEYVWYEGVGKLNPFNLQFIGERLDKPGMVFYKEPVLVATLSRGKRL